MTTIPLVWRYFGRICALTKSHKAFQMIFVFFEAYTHQISKNGPKFHFLEHKNPFLYNLQNMQSVVRQNHFLSSKSIKIKSKTFLRPQSGMREGKMRMRDAVTGRMRMRGAGCGFPHLIFPILISGSFEIIIFFIHLLEVLKTNEVVRNC